MHGNVLNLTNLFIFLNSFLYLGQNFLDDVFHLLNLIDLLIYSAK